MDFIQGRDAPVSFDGFRYVEIAGTHSEDKPTGKFMTGSKFIEVDTGLEFRYNRSAEPGSEWVQFPPADEIK